MDYTLIRWDVIASLMSIVGMTMIGNKDKWGHVVIIACQPVWWIVIIETEQYGLFILNVSTMFISIRNAVLWFKEEAYGENDRVRLGDNDDTQASPMDKGFVSCRTVSGR